MTSTASSNRDASDNGANKGQQTRDEVKAKAKEGAHAIESRAESIAAMGMARAEAQLRGLSRALETTRSELEQEDHFLASAFGSAHDRIDDAARSIADRDPGQLVGDAEGFARRNPWLFVGGCLVGGVALARFLKASDPAGYMPRHGQSARHQSPARRGPPPALPPNETTHAVTAHDAHDREDGMPVSMGPAARGTRGLGS